jgi:hypothetical protein
MPRKKKRDKISPAAIVDLGGMTQHVDGSETVTLLVSGVPLDLVENIGRVCARAILAAMEWPDDEAAAMTQRVVDHLAKELADAARHPIPSEAPRRGDMDDDIPF